jgi:hypothetical protein
MRIYRDAAAENQQLGDRTIRYRILRIIDGKPTELEVTETSMMSPSDLLRVTYEDARTSRATATELPGQAPDAAKDATSDVSGDASGQKTTVTGATQ